MYASLIVAEVQQDSAERHRPIRQARIMNTYRGAAFHSYGGWNTLKPWECLQQESAICTFVQWLLRAFRLCLMSEGLFFRPAR
jgi:hypothetical protein